MTFDGDAFDRLIESLLNKEEQQYQLLKQKEEEERKRRAELKRKRLLKQGFIQQKISKFEEDE